MRKSLALSKRSESNGFTLVELLIVMGVLAVVVVTILVTLNPSEAGKKSRDLKRMKDLATLEAIVLQWTQDGKAPFCTVPPEVQNYGCTSLPAGNVQSQSCESNWLKVNVCDYTKSVPVEPLNTRKVSYVCADANQKPAICPPPSDWGGVRYQLIMEGSDYEIKSFQESISNANNTFNDEGNNTSQVEVGSNLNLLP